MKGFWMTAAFVAGGASLFGVSINIFLLPYELIIGGSSGIATTAAHFVGGGVGIINILINLPIFIVAARRNGGRALAKTVAGTLAVSVATDVFSFLPPLVDDLLLCSLAGGGGMGLGSGLMLLRGFTSGGADLCAHLIRQRSPKLSTGRIILLMDIVIILSSAVILGNYSTLPYCLICSASYAFALDFVLGGTNTCRSVFVISPRHGEIADRLTTELDRGVTLLRGQGWYSGEDREVILCVVRRREEFELRRIVTEVDPDAFIVLHSGCEVLGCGFTEGA